MMPEWISVKNFWGKGTTVPVTSAVQGPPQSLFPVWQCGSPKDGLITLGCVTRDLAIADGVAFKWTDANGNALTNVVQYPAVQASKGYTAVSHARIKASEWDANKAFKCIVENAKGKKEAELRRPAPPPELPANLLLTAPSQTEIENGTATFICLASDFSPKTHTFKWTLENNDISNKVKSTIISQNKGNTTALSVLELTAGEWTGSSAPITCEFKQKKWTQTASAKYVGGVSEDIKVTIIPPSNKEMLIDTVGKLTCQTEKHQSFKSIKWLDEHRNQIASTKDESQNGLIILTTPISFVEWSNGTRFICEVNSGEFAQGFHEEIYERKEDNTEAPEVYLLGPPEITGDTVTLICYVKNFFPKEVAVSWLVNDRTDYDVSIYHQQITKEIKTNGHFSAYSHLVFAKAHWKTGNVFTCRVFHESLMDQVKLISRSIHYNSQQPTLVNLSLNSPSPCCNQCI